MSLEVIAGALRMDVAEVEGILLEVEPAVQERAVVGHARCRFAVEVVNQYG